jgi:hypothetical protein
MYGPFVGRKLACDNHGDQFKNRFGYLCPHGELAPFPLGLTGGI